MKKKKILVGVLVLIEIISIFLMFKSGNSKNMTKSEEKNEINKRQLAIMVKEDENGDYQEYQNDSNFFPSKDEYTFNIDKSECQDNNGSSVNTSEVLQANENGMITVTSVKTVYCTLYFDKIPDKEPPTIQSVTLTGTMDNNEDTTLASLNTGYTHTTNIKISANWDDLDVKSYCIDENSDGDSCSSYKELETSQTLENINYVITNSPGVEGEKTIYVHLKDKAGNIGTKSNTIKLDLTNPTATIVESSKTDTSITVSISGSDNGYNGSGIDTSNMYGRKQSDSSWSKTNGTYSLNNLSTNVTYRIEAYVKDKSGRKSDIKTSEGIKTYYCSTGSFQNDSSLGGICVKNATESTKWGGSTYSQSLGCKAKYVCSDSCRNTYSSQFTGSYQNSSSCSLLGSDTYCYCTLYRDQITTYSCDTGWTSLTDDETKCYNNAQ